MKKLLAAAAILASIWPASATTIPAGEWLILWGQGYFDFNNQTIEMLPGVSLPPQIPSSFLPVVVPGATFDYPAFPFGVDISVTNLLGNVLELHGPAGGFSMTALTQNITVNQPGYFVENGGQAVMTLTGFDPTGGTWGFAFAPINDPRSVNGVWEAMTYLSDGQPVSVPGPVVGNGMAGVVVCSMILLFLAGRRKHDKFSGASSA